MFDADRPILYSQEDKLNRATFAKYLARCLLDHHDVDSFVVGLYGGWGVGKTSIINLVIEELNFAETNLEEPDKPIILNFSAWSYSGQHQLIYSFFRRLSSALRVAPQLKNRERIIHLLELYVSFFTQKPIPRALRTPRSWYERLTFQGKEEIYAWESGRDLTLIKAELNELLREQSQKIIIIIDNISRLLPDEIKQIFQIVKSMGDYANTIYLLAFDKNQVAHAIDIVDGGGGNELIEKIVQLPFTIPVINPQDLENIFADRLKQIIANIPEDAWQKEYWADVYYSALKFFFHQCRDITRYVNSLNFSYARLKELVNPVDFFAITALEVFAPQVYFGVRDNKDLFTDLLDGVYVLDKDQIVQDKTRCEEILAREKRLSRDVILTLLMQIFPRVRKIYQPGFIFFHSDATARKQKRICSPDLFDLYFRLSMQTGQVPETEFHTIINLAEDPIMFDQALTRLNQDDRIIKFLDLLDSHIIEQIPAKHVQAIVTALFDNGDLFPQGAISPLSLDTPMRIARITHALLQRLEEPDERFTILQKAIGTANKSIYIIVKTLQEQRKQHLEGTDTFLPLNFRDLKNDQLESLCKLTASRIENWASSDRLETHPKLLALLYAWREWGDEEAVRRYVKKITHTDRGLIAFLKAAHEDAITQAMTEYQKRLTWDASLNDITAFIQPKELESHAKTLFEDEYFEKLPEREQLALMIFLDLMHTPTKKIIRQTSP